MLIESKANGAPASETQFYVNTQPYEPCSECLFFEWPSTAGGYGCPYATAYEVYSACYDPYARYGYDHLPRSSKGWTFENTGGCRLYSLGLKTLARMGNDSIEESESAAAKDVQSVT